VKVIDFGLANLYSPKDFLITNCGSIYFAAPELLMKQPYVGPEVDIWSLGVILFIMLYGRVPFEDHNLARLYDKVRRGDLHFPADPFLSVCMSLSLSFSMQVQLGHTTLPFYSGQETDLLNADR